MILRTLFQSNTIVEKLLDIKESIGAFVVRLLQGRLRKMPDDVVRCECAGCDKQAAYMVQIARKDSSRIISYWCAEHKVMLVDYATMRNAIIDEAHDAT
jgi:hypothetical protein